jgi:hypothetical protein
MALIGDGANGQGRKMEQLAQSPTLSAVSRLVSLGGWTVLFVLGAFFLPKLWDFGVGLQAHQVDLAESQKDLGHALDRVTWRLQSNEAHDERQDRRMDFHDKRFDRVEQGRSTTPPGWPGVREPEAGPAARPRFYE